jgi:hypothetical protein
MATVTTNPVQPAARVAVAAGIAVLAAAAAVAASP